MKRSALHRSSEPDYGTLQHKSNHDCFLAAWLTGTIDERPSCRFDTQLGWHDFVKLASATRVLPALRASAQGIGMVETIPAEILEVVVTSNVLNADRNEAALVQAQQLTLALNKVGIVPVALKGLANILTGIYPDLGSRFLADIDILIPANHFPKAVHALEKLGYSADPTHPVELSIGHSYPPLIRQDSLEVDLHRTSGLGICSDLLPANELISNSTVHNFRGAAIGVPNPTYLLIHHIIHSQVHDVYRERIAPSIRTLYDFYLLNRHFQLLLDWHFVEDLFRRLGQYPTLALYLMEAKQRFAIEPPVPIRSTPTLRFRRFRREFLRAYPFLRFVDPTYYWFAAFQPRTRRLGEILLQPGGFEYLVRKFFRADFYTRLRADFRSS